MPLIQFQRMITDTVSFRYGRNVQPSPGTPRPPGPPGLLEPPRTSAIPLTHGNSGTPSS